MKIFNRGRKTKQRRAVVQVVTGSDYEDLICSDYVALDHCPEIVAGCETIAELIGNMTIHLIANTEKGDRRITNELSRKIDINPEPNMTRQAWMTAIVMNLLLYGKGNSVVVPHTNAGYLESLEPISAGRVSFVPVGNSRRDYRVRIDGVEKDPAELLHFRLNPDSFYMWKGRGFTYTAATLANNLKQAAATEKGFMASKWKPSVIVKVDANIEEFRTPDGRREILKDYVESSEAGEPWLIPADQFQVEQVRPLSLADLAIDKTVELDRRMVAAILGVPAFVLGVGEFNGEAWNNFVNTKIKTIALEIQQEMTKKLILSDKMYLKFNIRSLLSYDLKTLADVYGTMRDRGIVDGNEARDALNLYPREGLDELIVLENYIPADKTGDQKKLNQ